MKEHKSTFAGLSFIPVRIVVAYAIFSFLWISSSIALLKFFIQARQIVTTLCIVNGLAYIIISSIVLLFLVRVAVKERKKYEEKIISNEQRLRQIIDLVPHFIFAKDIEGRFILVNRAVAQAYGTTVENLIGKKDSDFNESVDEVKHFREDDLEVIKSGKEKFIPEEVITDAKHQVRFLSTTKIPYFASGSNKPSILGISVDITQRKDLEHKLITLAHYDALTNLPNRTFFFERASMGISHARRAGACCAVFFVDLDHFKNVNDTMGHTIGDELLKDTAVKLIECIREVDTLARLGGDEFIVFLNGLESPESASQIAQRIVEKFDCPRQIWGHDLYVTASVGIAIYPTDGKNLEDLLKNADTAMYEAKKAGRNRYYFFNQEMNERAVHKMQVERGLREALSKSQFRLYYQPIINVKDHSVRGFEVLLRCLKDNGAVVMPQNFIPIAEDTGLILEIGDWVLNESCCFARKVKNMGFEDMVISINVSVVQLRRKEFIDSIKKALSKNKLSARSLEIEVTESIFIESFDVAIENLKKIKNLGVHISLDDFGTGYSSLRHLQRLPISILKIDQNFIKEINKGGIESAMASTIITLAHTLKLGVIAEGVEKEEQLKRLVQENCDYSQGFLFSKPIPEESALDFLQQKKISIENGFLKTPIRP